MATTNNTTVDKRNRERQSEREKKRTDQMSNALKWNATY